MFLSKLAESFENYDDPSSLGTRMRAKRFSAFRSLLEQTYNEKGSVRVLDLGGTQQYWRHLIDAETLRSLNCTITIVNPLQDMSEKPDPHFELHSGDGTRLTYEDNAFDIVHSNSVIEHVGDWSDMLRFASEVRRVARRYFIQTPHYWFPYEPHFLCPFFHWLPKPIRVNLVMRFSLGPAGRIDDCVKAVSYVEGARLLNRRMFTALFPDAEISTERFLLLPKSMVASRDS